MRQVFTDDVVIDTTESGGGVVHGRRRVHRVPARRARRGGHGAPRPHARDRAHVGRRRRPAIWALQDILIWPDGIAPRRATATTTRPTRRRRRLADRLVDADPPAHGHGRRREVDLMPVAVITGGGVGVRPRPRPSGARERAWTWRCSTSTANGPRPRRPAWPRPTGSTALALAVDVADEASVVGAAAAVEERFGGADLVVSNVGVQLFGAIDAFTDDEWRWLLDVNVIGSARVGPGVPPAAPPRRRRSAGVHDVVVDARPRRPPRRLPGEQVRGLGPGRDASARARRRRHRRVGHLPVGDDHPPPRDRARPPNPRTCAGRSPTTTTSTP